MNSAVNPIVRWHLNPSEMPVNCTRDNAATRLREFSKCLRFFWKGLTASDVNNGT
jgi:hypothetical protein